LELHTSFEFIAIVVIRTSFLPFEGESILKGVVHLAKME